MASDQEPKLVADARSLCCLLNDTLTPLLGTTCTHKDLDRISVQIKPALAELSAHHDTCKASHAEVYDQIGLAGYLVKLLRVLLPNILTEAPARNAKVASRDSCCKTGLRILHRMCVAAVNEDHEQADAAVLSSSLLRQVDLRALTDREPGNSPATTPYSLGSLFQGNSNFLSTRQLKQIVMACLVTLSDSLKRER